MAFTFSVVKYSRARCMCRAWGLKVWEDGARLLATRPRRSGPQGCVRPAWPSCGARPPAPAPRLCAASRCSAGEAGLGRWISLRPVKPAVKWSCGGTSPRVAQTGGLQSYSCCGDLLAQVTAGQARRGLHGGRRESAGGAPRGEARPHCPGCLSGCRAVCPAVGCRAGAVRIVLGLSGLSGSLRLAFRQSGSRFNAFVTSKSRILWLRISG